MIRLTREPAMNRLLLLLLGTLLTTLQLARADLARFDLSQRDWQLTNANLSISVNTKVPAYTLSVLATAGIIPEDPLYRYGERETRWVSEEDWTFNVTWPSRKHQLLLGCRHVLLVLHGIDTYGTVLLNEQLLLQADNAHRSWWVPLPSADLLREGANSLAVELQPAAAVAATAKAAYPYPVPTMQVPGGINVYNFVRKPAFDFGWDWGPAFVPAGVSGGVELVGFDRATLIGALVSQAFNASGGAFDLTVTAHFLVPAGGDNGTLSLTLAVLDLHQEQQVELQPSVVAGNELQALVTVQLQVPADKVKLWQPLTLQAKGGSRALYDLAIVFEPSPDPQGAASTCGVDPQTATSGSSSGSTGSGSTDSSGSSSGSSGGRQRVSGGPQPELRSAVVRRVGFRTVELVQQPMESAGQELLPGTLDNTAAAATAAAARGGSSSNSNTTTPQQKQQQEQKQQQPVGESFYFKVNGVPVYAKGANLIPLHVLSTAVSQADVESLLQSAVDANHNMVRIWGGGRYQIDGLYDVADELGLMVWQEAMFACSPYPRNAAFLSNVEAEVTQQLLRLGSHPSMVVFGGNNEVEQSLGWYAETKDNVPLYVTDYSALFVDTIGKVASKLLPNTPWVDSSPSRATITVPAIPILTTMHNSSSNSSNADVTGSDALGVSVNYNKPSRLPASVTKLYQLVGGSADAGAPEQPASIQDPAAAGAQSVQPGAVHVKRWGNTNDPAYGDVHFYNYRADCQDWKTYPHARFVSEYGWQSYPSWATYAAATAAGDWQLASNMTEYRQRHPGGTKELLTQLQRRFKLPKAWLSLLPQPQQHKQPAPQQQQPTPKSAAGAGPRSRAQVVPWLAALQNTVRSLLALGQWLLLPLPASSTAADPGRPGPATEHASPASALKPGVWHDHSCSSSSSGSCRRRRRLAGVTEQPSEMQHFIYLTQLQQMLCYETAMYTWRRLRSDASTLMYGVLYWQLNDVWAGASWSSIDYGGVWKPAHYGVARAFADVALSVQHDLQADTISVYAVSDLQQPVSAKLAVRLLSLTDTAATCGSAGAAEPDTSSSSSSGNGYTIEQYAFKTASYTRLHLTQQADVPAGAASLLWSGSVASLLEKASRCNRSSCYVHMVLASEGQQPQEAVVWLAPFKELPLQDPQLNLSGVQLTPAEPGLKVTGSDTVSAHRQQALSLTVSSKAVAVYAVLETQGPAAAGHFSDNAFTVHPCEPRQVSFKPGQAGRREWQPAADRPAAAVSSNDGGSSGDSRSGGSSGSGSKSGSSSSCGDGSRSGSSSGDSSSEDSSGSTGNVTEAGSRAGVAPEQDRVLLQANSQLGELLQEQLVVSSLWDHQQFDQPLQQQPGHKKMTDL